MRRTLIVIVIIVGSLFAGAKRVPPKPVIPLVQGGIEYSADGDGRDQYLVATDAMTKKELRRARVFHTRIKFWMEEDVQWVFITNLFSIANDVGGRDEKARCYRIATTKKNVKKIACP